MKTTFFVLLVLLTICTFAHAEVYLIFDKKGKEVYSVSGQNDTVVPEGKELVVLKGTIDKLGLERNPVYYKFIDGDFILNNDKINADYQMVQDLIAKEKDMKLIDAKVKEMAYDALVAEGVVFKKISKEDLK